MPINKKWPIAALLDAARRFPLEHGRRVTFEYVLLAGVNDSDADADRLPRLLRGIPCEGEPHPLEPASTGPSSSGPSARAHPDASRSACARPGLPSTSASPRGDDIDAACGQLAARELVQSARMSAADELDEAPRAGDRRLRPHRRVLGLHAHDGARLRPALPVARAAAPGRDPGAPRHLGRQRLDDAGGARPLGRRAQDLGARPAPRALPGRDRLLEDDLGRAQRARAPRDRRRRRRRRAAPRPPRAPPRARPAAAPAKADADFVVERVSRLGEICRNGETMLDMLLGQLTLDVGRFRDVLKVAPRAPAPAASNRAACPRPAPRPQRERADRPWDFRSPRPAKRGEG